jgi:hypothetical protein
MTENERVGLVFLKTGSINSGTGLFASAVRYDTYRRKATLYKIFEVIMYYTYMSVPQINQPECQFSYIKKSATQV